VVFLFLAIGFIWINRMPHTNLPVNTLNLWVSRLSGLLLIFFILLPLAMTMALIWRTKEVILDAVFGSRH